MWPVFIYSVIFHIVDKGHDSLYAQSKQVYQSIEKLP